MELYASGFSHPCATAAQRFTPYRELIHVTGSAAACDIAAEHGCYWIPRAAFAEPGAHRR